MYGLRIVLADPDPVFRVHLKEKLIKTGYTVVAEASDGRSALQLIFNIQPDLVILNLQLPGRSGLEIAQTITEHRVAPVILMAELDKQDELQDALLHWPFSYILKPVDEVNLFPAIAVCVAGFRKLCQVEQENRKLRETIEIRKILDKAKGLLIEFRGMTEQQAFKYIQKVSMDKCMPVKSVAREIIMALDSVKSGKGSDRV